MEGLDERYAALVTELASPARPIEELAADADRLAEASPLTWLAVQARALGAAARLGVGPDAALVAVAADVAIPAIEGPAESALDGLLPGSGPPVERLAAHRAATHLPADQLLASAQRLIEILQARAREDLDLSDDESVVVELGADSGRGAPRASTMPDGRRTRLWLNSSMAWAADQLVRVVAGEAYPGRHLARIGRPAAPSWDPSPETTVLHGLAEVGREVLLGDHELAYEVERVGRAAGVRWHGRLAVSVLAARAALAPHLARAALAPVGQAREALRRLGFDSATTDCLIDRWRQPLGPVDAVARAGGPPLVRDWLVAQGQTAGLQRLVTARLVPTQLRAELADGS